MKEQKIKKKNNKQYNKAKKLKKINNKNINKYIK